MTDSRGKNPRQKNLSAGESDSREKNPRQKNLSAGESDSRGKNLRQKNLSGGESDSRGKNLRQKNLSGGESDSRGKNLRQKNLSGGESDSRGARKKQVKHSSKNQKRQTLHQLIDALPSVDVAAQDLKALVLQFIYDAPQTSPLDPTRPKYEAAKLGALKLLADILANEETATYQDDLLTLLTDKGPKDEE